MSDRAFVLGHHLGESSVEGRVAGLQLPSDRIVGREVRDVLAICVVRLVWRSVPVDAQMKVIPSQLTEQSKLHEVPDVT